MPSRLLYIAIKLYLTVLLTLLTRISKKKSLIQPRGASCRAQFNTNRVSSRDETQITSVCRLFPPLNCSDPRKQCTARSPRFDSTFFHSGSPSPLRSFFLLPSDVSLLHPPFNCARVFSNTRLFVISSILGEFSERSRKRSGSSILWERKKRNRPSYRAPRFDPFEELMRREKCYFFSWFCCARGTAGVNEARELVFVPFFCREERFFFYRETKIEYIYTRMYNNSNICCNRFTIFFFLIVCN